MLLWSFNKYPGTDYETFNWEWLINIGKKMEKALHDLFSDTGALHQMVDKVLGEHPEWTTTVMDGAISTQKLMNKSVTVSKLADETLDICVPYITDFGPNTYATLTDIINNTEVTILRCAGSITTDTPVVINRPITLICEDFTITQTRWGWPGIDVQSDDVNILGEITIINDVNARPAITTPTYHPGNNDPKSDSAGILLGYQQDLKNFHAERVNAYNFIGGICNVAHTFKNINIDYLYVQNVDMGLFGSNFINSEIGVVEFKDMASYTGSTDPSHVVYLTGGENIDKSINVRVGFIKGDGCRSKKTDTLLSIKSAANFHCDGGYVDNIAGLASVVKSTGYIKDFIVVDGTAGVNAQLTDTDFLIKNITYRDINVSNEYINFCTTGAHLQLQNITHKINSDDDNYAYTYVSGTGSDYTEIDCVYDGPSDSNTHVYNRSGTPGFHVECPKTNIALFTGNLSSTNAKTLLDPGLLNYPKSNTLVPNPQFVNNNKIVDEQESRAWPMGFRTNNHVRVADAEVAYFNNNNETNGVVYTLYNGGNVSIQYGTRLITKTGESYGTDDWTIFRFMNVGNVAYEI